MSSFRIIRASMALAMILWCGITFAARSHQPRVHRSLRHSINSRSDSHVEPFLVTVVTPQAGSKSTLTDTNPHNMSAYLVGEAPDPKNPGQFFDFLAQHSKDGSTNYFTPPDNTRQGLVRAAPATVSWKVGPAGTGFKTPGAVKGGRIYLVADGHLDFYTDQDKKIIHPDPHNAMDVASRELWGFIEFTHMKDPSSGDESMIVNLSFVDWVSLPLGIGITSKSKNGTNNVTLGGLEPDGLARVCEALSALGSFWPRLCMRSPNKTPIRVMSPEKYISLHSDDKDATNYYEPYINTVWEKYKNVDLQINTQVDGPNSVNKVDNGRIITCRVGSEDNLLHCDNDAGDFARPVSRDIYGCNSGPFANPASGTESWSRSRVRPRLCAAFARSTLHLDGVQPSYSVGPDKYYQHPITNHYSKVVHENLIGGSGYAFSYDDVAPDSTSNSAGLITTEHPIRLDIHINI